MTNIEAAMGRALQAEVEAEAEVAQCQREGEQLLLAAQHLGRQLLARTDARISTIHQGCAKQNKQRTRTLVQEGHSAPAGHEGWTDAHLAQATESLAARLTGAGPDPFAVEPL